MVSPEHIVSLEDVSTGSKELLSGLSRIRKELDANFVDLRDGYAARMFPFVADSMERVLALRDQVFAAGKAFNEVKAYYGEGDGKYDSASTAEYLGKPTSLEFFGIFKSFVTSWDVSHTKGKGVINHPVLAC